MLKFIKALLRHSLDTTAAWLGNNTTPLYGVLVTVAVSAADTDGQNWRVIH
jgi:hypothetical protein